MADIHCITKTGKIRMKRPCREGDQVGDWLVLGQRRINPAHGSRDIEWLCRCLGGFCDKTEKWVKLSALFTGHSARCNKCGSKLRERKDRAARAKKHWNRIIPGNWCALKTNAATRGIEISITKEEAESLFTGRCALTGWPISLRYDDHTGKGGRMVSSSLDRIDSAKGYTLGNVQWVHKDVNLAKRMMSVEGFVKLCRAVSDYAEEPSMATGTFS